MTTKNELFKMLRLNDVLPMDWPTDEDAEKRNLPNMPTDWGWAHLPPHGVVAYHKGPKIDFDDIVDISFTTEWLANKATYTEWFLKQKPEESLSGIAMHNPNWKKATDQQVKPQGEGAPVLGFVLSDLTNRALMGKAKYGEPLKVFNGRRSVTDLLQELYDGVMYAKQLELELEDIGNDIADIMQVMSSMESMDKPSIDAAVKDLGGILQKFKSLR